MAPFAPGARITMTGPTIAIRHLPFAVALAVLLWGVNLAGRAVATEETATSSTEIVAETGAVIDATGHIADIPVVPLADAVTTADGMSE